MNYRKQGAFGGTILASPENQEAADTGDIGDKDYIGIINYVKVDHPNKVIYRDEITIHGEKDNIHQNLLIWRFYMREREPPSDDDNSLDLDDADALDHEDGTVGYIDLFTYDPEENDPDVLYVLYGKLGITSFADGSPGAPG